MANVHLTLRYGSQRMVNTSSSTCTSGLSETKMFRVTRVIVNDQRTSIAPDFLKPPKTILLRQNIVLNDVDN